MDTAALTFGQLLERHERELFAYALRLSGQRADAEDLYQDTFLAAFRAWPPPRRGNERAWLYKIATNRAIDRERRAKRIVANVDDLAIAAPERDDVTLADLAGAIETLPAGQRAAFVLRKVQGLPYLEIAVALDCSEEAARARVSEALKKLKSGGGLEMTMDLVIGEARERLLARAKREGLATVGYDVLESPLGPLWVAIGPKGVMTIHYGDEPSDRELRRLVRVYGPGVVPDHRRSSVLARELDQYFNGTRREFDVAVDLAGLTPFQTKVLAATAKIPFGAVSTYGAVAKRAGNARASRATGGALNQNPIPIVVPCHRVVGSNGSLVGYAGGLDAKRRLLAIEGADVARRH